MPVASAAPRRSVQPLSSTTLRFAEACVIVIKSDEEPATMEPEKAKTAQRKAEEEAAKDAAQEEAKKTVAEGKEAIAAKREANEDAAKKKQAEEAKTKAEHKKTLEPETNTVKGEAETAKNKQVEEGAAKQKLAAQESPAKKTGMSLAKANTFTEKVIKNRLGVTRMCESVCISGVKELCRGGGE